MAHLHKIFQRGLVKLAAETIVWVRQQSSGRVHVVDVDGISNGDFWQANGTPAGICIDEELLKVFWANYISDAIRTADYDGSNEVVLNGSVADPWECDTDATLLYFAGFGNSRLRKLDKNDGSGLATVLTTVNHPRGIQSDIPNAKLYYGIRNAADLRVVDDDGSNDTKIIDTSGFCYSTDVDVESEHVYYVDQGTPDALRRVDYDGSNDTLIFQTSGGSPSNSNVQGMAIDLEGGFIFWSDVIDDNIGRVELDGSNPDKTYVGSVGAEPNAVDVQYPQGSFYAKPNR